ncbi:MAG: hypothetical protein VKJ02_15935 [Snowella sp.]|nr:hypothetical protein [Snowella sp.]
MNTWDFLIQADGEQTWISLSDRAPVTEGKYRLMAQTGKPHAEIDIGIAYYSGSEKIPQKKRYSRLTDAEGALMIFPWFSLTVGRWQIYCRPNMMEQLCGANWKQTLTVEVAAKSTVTGAIAYPTPAEQPETVMIPTVALDPAPEIEIQSVNLEKSQFSEVLDLEKIEPSEPVAEIPTLREETEETEPIFQEDLKEESLNFTDSEDGSSEPEIDFELLLQQNAENGTFLEKTGLELPGFEEDEISLEIFAKRDLPLEHWEPLPENSSSLEALEQNLTELVQRLIPPPSEIAIAQSDPDVLPRETLETIPVLEAFHPQPMAEPVLEKASEPMAEKDAIAVIDTHNNRELEEIAEGELDTNKTDSALVSLKMQTKTYVVELIDLENNAAFTLDIEIAEVENGHFGKIDLPQPDRMRKMLYKTNYFSHRKILPPKLYPHRPASQRNKPIQLAKFKPCPISA